jgi:uncharacterized RDD family membrane protein YckC
MSWYVRRGECDIGPLGEDALRALVGTGQITADTPLWREGLSGWTAALELPGVLGPLAVARVARLTQSSATGAAEPGLPPAMRAPDSARPTGIRTCESPRAAASSSLADETLREVPRPWRRYWARALDVTVSSFLVAVLVSALRPSLLAGLSLAAGGRWTILLILLPFAMVMDTLVYWALGNTPGKAIAGIKVLEDGGRSPVSAAAYLRRNFGVYLFGLGLGLPLVSLITQIWSYRRAAAGEVVAWDRFSGSGVYVLSGGETRTWAAAGTYLLGIAALFAVGLHAQRNNSRYAAARAPVPILQQELTQAANSVNATVPRMVDRITRLDGAHVGPGSLFTYEYTLTNMHAARLSPTALETLRWRLSAHVRQAVCRGAALKPMLSTGTTIRFHYRDQQGQELATVSVASADCAG